MSSHPVCREIEPDLLAKQVADLAWAGLRGIHRVEPT